MESVRVEVLDPSDYGLVRPLLVDLYLSEQPHYGDHPQLSATDLESGFEEIPSRFAGENVIFVTRDRGGALAGFCWCVLFDPGTGLEGEVAEVYVSASARGRGVGEALVARAITLFKERGVTLGYVWTRPDNQAALRLYQGAGFSSTRQAVLTWYPIDK